MHRLIPIALALLALTPACSGVSSPPAAPTTDLGHDLTVLEDTAALDLPSTELPALADAPEEPTSLDASDAALAAADADDRPSPADAARRCATDSECVGHPDGPVCHAETGRCVPCTPTSDRCPAGQYCFPSQNRCVPGCRDDAACAALGGPTRYCDRGSRTCSVCLDDGHCALGTRCVGGACVTGCSTTRPCPSGQRCCADACVDVETNSMSCGACGRVCALPNAAPACRGGSCAIGSCTPSFADCDGDPANGCETDLGASVGACGACGARCDARPNTAPRCEAGACRYTCVAGFGDCDGNVANGCEANLATTPEHCGACGRTCSLPRAVAGCSLGSCTVAACDAGHGDCNRNVADGCEVDLRSSTAHCGACGRSCSLPQASAACSAGACVVSACSALYGDCDAVASNGCEAALSAVASCGACGVRCPAPAGPHTAARCVVSGSSASCGAACESGYTDCDGNLANGCEAAGACTRTREVFSDNFMAGVGGWSLPRGGGGAAFGVHLSIGGCRNPTLCFGCDVCMTVHGYCDSYATATLATTFDFTRVVSGLFTFYSTGSPGGSDRFVVQASLDRGATWRSLTTPLPSAFSLNTASPQRVDLTELAGARSVQFRFLFENNCDPGDRFGISWTIDDVTITVVERTY